MIFGICSKSKSVSKKDFLNIFPGEKNCELFSSSKSGLAYLPDSLKTAQQKQSGFYEDKKRNMILMFQGHVFNEDSIRQQLALPEKFSFPQIVLESYLKNGVDSFSKFNGHFAIAIYDQTNHKLILIRDHFGVEPIYYYQDQDQLIFSSDFHVILKKAGIPREINAKGIYAYLLFNYIPIKETLVSNLLKLPPAHQLEWENGNAEIHRYWQLSFQQNKDADEKYFTEEILNLLKDSVELRLGKNGERPGAFLSGGMDSSSIVGLGAPELKDTLETYSFRCKGKSFDESHYAQIMSDEYGTNHHLVEFPPEEMSSIEDLVELMSDPFSDIGIEIASFLLARNAANHVDYILTGDGGDELFAGHPVYIADKVAKVFDAVPGFIRNPIVHLMQYLPDTDKKKSLVVKAKRFSYSFNFPNSLYSNRWRIYYTDQELKKALHEDFWNVLQKEDPLKDIEAYYDDADGEDFLSRTLYGDYLTVVNFYLNRMYILRQFGIEARFPMFDYRLVEFAATIPSDFKIKGNNDTKYILKKTMAGVLPDSIVFRKDKLGHSVPMKNWMRDDPSIRQLIETVLSEENVQRRGFFKPEFVKNLIDEHMAKKCNHSHRLWALLVLELWLQKHFDTVE